jgi:predicted Fe-Mo cluster-binding NifX family protein
MGEGAVRVLASHGIKVVRGASGDARLAARSFAEGALSDSGRGCAGHEEGHECGS